MASLSQLLLTAALVGGILAFPAAPARAQELPVPDEVAVPPAESDVAPEFLKTLPHPLDQPRSLLQPASSFVSAPPDFEQPYFELDPLLDPPQWPGVGWFWDVQVAGVGPHIQNQMIQTVGTTLGTSILVAPGNAPVSWTVAPRIELGYRLPSGFGEFSISDTGFTTNGADTVILPDGPAMRTSALQINYTDLDYLSREFTPWTNWGMKWRAGVRISESFTTTAVSQPFAQAAAGSGVLFSQASNATFGAGPHFAVELERCLSRSGFSLVGKVDVSDNYSIIRQRFAAVTTTFVSPGVADSGVQIDRFENQIVTLTGQIGLAWQPPRLPGTQFFVGYINQTWWNVMANENLLSQGQFSYQGVFLRAAWNY
jgi:hypothetical protein